MFTTGVVSLAHFIPSGLFQSSLLQNHACMWPSVTINSKKTKNKYKVENEIWALLDVKRGHASEEDSGAIRVNVGIDPFGPCIEDSRISFWARDFIVLSGPFIEGASSVAYRTK